MNALAIREGIDLAQLQTLGTVFVQSKFFTDTTQAAQAIVKVMAGAELGFPAIASMTGVYIVKGKVTLSSNLMAAAIKKSVKYNYRVREHNDDGCKIEFFEDSESIGFSAFSRDDAVKAGLMGSDTWRKFFRNMCFARALSNGAKWHCPDIFGGPIYTPDELGATIDGETGDVIDLPVEPSRPDPSEDVPLEKREAMAKLCILNANLGYEPAKLLKWLKNKFGLDKEMTLNAALLSLSLPELEEAIGIFDKQVNPPAPEPVAEQEAA